MSNEASTPAPVLPEIYTPGQRAVLDELSAIQASLDLGDSEFAKKHLTVSATTWYRIRKGDYGANADQAFVKLACNLQQYRIESAKTAKLVGGRPWHALPQQQSVIDAVTSAKLKDESDPDRLVVFLAETGGGKTALGRQLKLRHDGILVEATESWRDSYFAALADIAEVAGVDADDLDAGKHVAERALLRRLNANRRVLIIDEGEYFGPRTINLVKLLLNKTPTVVVILAIPSLYARWQQRAWDESKQINRRAEAIVDGGLVTPDDVRLFVAERFGGAEPSVCAPIAKAANQFGRFDTVVQIVREIDIEDGAKLTRDEVEQAITRFNKRLRRIGGAA
jgi:hypothetical protein